MFCIYCGRLLPEGSHTCGLCGGENRRQSQFTETRPAPVRPAPAKYGWLVALCSALLSICLTPVAGIILYYAIRRSDPAYARHVKTGTKVSAILLLVYLLLVFLILMIVFSLAIL